ncbi:MAG TPA: ABC transporter substrate-binding protein [Candidatus Corynebacterium avicola]|uniref:ABC transporter substrate-binding protein n=1 Tax=Candidatus Corynebacterium avicola TaxID=2838527 RepID=A0A9D1RNE6_9CORY|nr:ABC transporter substrate-binding protein [Candidatus Corynebacterium avicola]
MPTEPSRTLLTEEQFEQVKDLPVISTVDGVNVEEVAGLDPDLILVPNMIEPEVTDQLREVAPSYIYTHGGEARGEWEGRIAQIADVTNRTEEAETLAEELKARQEELAEKHADIAGELKVSMFGAWEPGEFSANGSGSMLGKIITPVGVQFADGVEEATRDADGYEQSLSTEEITSVFGDSDVIFHSELLDGSTDGAETDAVLEMPTFQALPAAEDDHVYGIGKSTIAGYTDASYVLDRLDEILTELAEE